MMCILLAADKGDAWLYRINFSPYIAITLLIRTFLIKNLYENNEICVMNIRLQSDWVRMESWLKQGCEYCGIFFLVLHWVIKNSLRTRTQGIEGNLQASKKIVTSLTHDIALISSKFNIQNKITAFKGPFPEKGRTENQHRKDKDANKCQN